MYFQIQHLNFYKIFLFHHKNIFLCHLRKASALAGVMLADRAVVWMTCWSGAETWTGSLTFVACEEAVVCWPLYGPGLVGDQALMLLHSPPAAPPPRAPPSGGPEGLCWALLSPPNADSRWLPVGCFIGD